ncbi:2Fe-2S iron-sulfur cluster binding domain-containing protein, partial [Candidatus Micrarchaeota archaeon]|nr:2Fe-2S iron-sulfur cluster binding domain-containing protein [Candidatus Micrarchaeota archaeon]
MEELVVRIFRFEHGTGHWLDEYRVPKASGMTVLGALAYIHENLDETLAIDYNCRAGRCGTCGVIANGKAVLACETTISADMREITIAPKNNQEIVKDLISRDPDVWEIRRRILREIPFTTKEKEPYVIFPYQTEKFQNLDTCIE